MQMREKASIQDDGGEESAGVCGEDGREVMLNYCVECEYYDNSILMTHTNRGEEQHTFMYAGGRVDLVVRPEPPVHHAFIVSDPVQVIVIPVVILFQGETVEVTFLFIHGSPGADVELSHLDVHGGG